MTTYMRQSRRQSYVIVVILLLALLMTAGWFEWFCTRDNRIAFLPTKPGAEWIVYPKSPDGVTQSAIPIRAVFRHTFLLSTPPTGAALTVRTFRSATVVINGQQPGHLELADENWKPPSTADVAGLLRAGTNDITVYVTNTFGPPALWLRLQTGQLSQGTDEHWQVSLAGAAWQNARRAAQPPAILSWNQLHGGERTLDSVRRVWPLPLMFCAVAVIVVWVANHRLRQRDPRVSTSAAAPPAKLIYSLLIVVIVARAALFINNLPQLPRSTGFDTNSHEQYIRFIQEKGSLPLPANGWEMYQPPLYYLCSAILLDVCGLSVPDDHAAFVLRTMNGVAGLIHCWLAFLCFRLLFPKNLSAQAAGLLVAAFLPPHLYLSQYVTNEPLAGLLVTVALYFLLRVLQTERESFFLHLGIGIALGAAMLTKVSSLLAVPLFLAALGLRLLARRNYPPRDWLRNVGVVVLSFLVVCGWHYARIWARFGNPIIGNWQINAFAWWQDPGFRTSAYYFGFGRVLVTPLFSGIFSFADGIYSTLWGDGLASGVAGLAFRPPWNYDLMNAGYLLALVISALFITGLVIALARFIRQPKLEWFVLLGLVGIFVLGIIYMSLRVPSYAQVKAFYAFPALVPFSALVAVGWNRLGRKHRALRAALWVILLVWTMTVYAAFWIRSDNPETHRLRGSFQITQQHYAEAAASLSEALRLKPDDAETHYFLAEALNNQNEKVEAIRHYREAVRLDPDATDSMNDLAWMLATSNDSGIRNGDEAVRLAERACELTQYRETMMVGTLAAAYAEAGRFEEAVATAQKACALASESGQQELLEKNQELLEMYRNHEPYRDVASPNQAEPSTDGHSSDNLQTPVSHAP